MSKGNTGKEKAKTAEKDPRQTSKADFPAGEWKQYRKAPVVIEAMQVKEEIKIPTLEGEMTASPDDFIIQGVKGEFYPCKPDIFAKTYNPVNGDAPTDSQLAQDYHNLKFTVLPRVTEERDAARHEVEELQASLKAHKAKLKEATSAMKRWAKDLDVFDSKGANQRKAQIVECLPDDDPASTAYFLKQRKPIADKPVPSESGAMKAWAIYQFVKPRNPSDNVFVKVDGVVYSLNGDAQNAATALKLETAEIPGSRLKQVPYIAFVPEDDGWINKMRATGQGVVIAEKDEEPVVHKREEPAAPPATEKATNGKKPGPETTLDPRGSQFFWLEAKRLHIDKAGGDDLIGMWKAQHDLEELSDAEYEKLAKQLPALVAGALKKAFEAINAKEPIWLGREPYELTDGRHQLVVRVEETKQVYVVPVGADVPAHHLMALAKGGKLKIGDPIVAANSVVKMYATESADSKAAPTPSKTPTSTSGGKAATKPPERVGAGKPEGNGR